MKRLFTLATLLALTLSGCTKAAPDAATGNPDNHPSGAGTGAAPTPEASIDFTPPTGRLISTEDVPLLDQINRENVEVLDAALPTIVRITATRPIDPHVQLFGTKIPFQFHMGPGTPDFTQNEPSYGSGIIISKDGYIVTNYHVIEDSKDVEVELQDKRSFPARIIASDSPLDVAVLKIEATDLTALPWGDSDKVRVGEQVFAIGNPFNLEDSATRGIVSATGRNLPDSTNYENYIQTDAAINLGNSGGALINIHGELIGINAAIASFTRGNEGVGFAIPSNLARYAVESLLKEGKLVRGFLGVRLPSSIDEGVTEQLGLETDRGALLAGVQQSSPADQAKLRPVDFITEIDGHKIDGVSNLRLLVAQLPVGKKVVVNYIRGGSPQTTTAKIVELPKDADQDFHSSPLSLNNNPVPETSEGASTQLDNVLSGLQVADLTDQSRLKFGSDDLATTGVVITGVEAGSLAEAKGLLRGDVIEIVSTHRASVQPVTNAKDFIDLAKNLKADQSVVLLVQQGKSSDFIYLAPEAR